MNGLMYWNVHDPTDGKSIVVRKIVRFHPRENTFHDFPSPQSKFGHGNEIVGLQVLDRRLCMVHADNASYFY